MENQPIPQMKASLILCEVLVYAEQENKNKLKKILDKLQKQIDKSKTNQSKVRVLWYADSGEKTIEEKKKWLIDESNCIFYVFAPVSLEIADNYIANLMIGVNMFDRSLALLRKEGIVMKKTRALKDSATTTNEPQAPLEILD